MPGHLPMETGRQGDEAPVQFLEQLFIHPGPVIKTLQVGLGDQLDQVLVALAVHGQKHQMVVVALARLAVMAAAGGHIDLAAQQGLDARGLGLLVKIQHPEEGAVIGNGHRRHFQIRGPFQKIGNTHRAVQQAISGVHVQVDEF